MKSLLQVKISLGVKSFLQVKLSLGVKSLLQVKLSLGVKSLLHVKLSLGANQSVIFVIWLQLPEILNSIVPLLMGFMTLTMSSVITPLSTLLFPEVSLYILCINNLSNEHTKYYKIHAGVIVLNTPVVKLQPLFIFSYIYLYTICIFYFLYYTLLTACPRRNTLILWEPINRRT